jgi:hypothetical protein
MKITLAADDFRSAQSSTAFEFRVIIEQRRQTRQHIQFAFATQNDLSCTSDNHWMASIEQSEL